jgi:hypothetical protein
MTDVERLTVASVPHHHRGMRGTEPPIFRPTLWPGPLNRSTAVRFELGPPVAGLAAKTGRGDPVEIPADFSIREALVPEDENPEQVLTFMREWGPLCRVGDACLDSLPRGDLTRLVEDDQARASAAGVSPQIQGSTVSLAVAARHLTLLQTSALHVIAHLDGNEEAMLDAWTGLVASDPESAREAWLFWQTYNTAALRPFQAHVRLEGNDPHAGILLGDPTTYELAQLQLAEIVTGQSGPLPRCANKRCGLPFVRHRGRSRYDGTHHSTGVRYCSHRCAKAQSERDRRHRRKAEAT